MSDGHHNKNRGESDGRFVIGIADSDKQTLIDAYVGGEGISKVAERWRIARPTAKRIIVESGITLRPRSTITEMDAEARAALVQRYRDGESAPDIAKSIGCDHVTIYRLLRQAGIEIRSQSEAKRVDHPLREDAFDEPLTPAAAYFVGMLMTDGCVTDTRGNPTIALSLQERDRGLVEELTRFLGSTNAICETTSIDNGIVKSRDGQPFKSARVAFTSRRLADALARYGVVPRKSKTAKVIGLEMDRDFWRGAVDGDGSLGIDERGMASVSLCGSETLVHQFAAYIKSVSPTCAANPFPTKSIFAVSASGSHAYRVAEALYGDCCVALDRKLEKAREILARPDPFVNRTLRWGDVTVESLDRLYAEIGSWTGVAERLGMTLSSLSCVRLRLGHRTTKRQRAEAEAVIPAVLVQRRLFD
jgi:hypothetical protein